MAVYDFEIGGGEVVQVEAPTYAEALKVLQSTEAPPPAPVTAGGLAEAGGAALARGGGYLAGLPGTIRDINQRVLKKGMQKGYELATGEAPDAASESGVERFFATPGAEIERQIGPTASRVLRPIIGNYAPTGQQVVETMGELTGGATDRQPQNVPEEYLRTIGEFAPSGAAITAATGGTGLLPYLMATLFPALGSETAGQVAREYAPGRPDWMPDWAPSAETAARVAGSFAGPGVVAAGRKVITPHPTNAARVKAARLLDKEGIDYSAGQKTGVNKLRYKESETGGAHVADLLERQAEQFTSAALKRIGVKADRADDVVMQEAATRIGGMFDRLASRNNLLPDVGMVRDLRAAVKQYTDKVSPTNRSPVVSGAIKDIIADAQKGTITGKQYQNYITRLREAGEGATGDLQITLGKIRSALDNAMERGIAVNNPKDLGAWRVARNNYRDLRAIEDTLATGAKGEEGLLNPTKLSQVTTQQVGKRAAVQGKSDLNELAKAGKLMLRDLPQSGTVPRMMARLGSQTLNALGGGGVGGSIGGLLGGPIGAAIGGAVGAGTGPVLSSLARGVTWSKPIQKYLGNQLLKKQPPLLSDKPAGGLLRVLEQEQAAERAAKSRRYSGGRHAD